MIQTKSHRKYLFTPLRYPGGKTSLFEFFDQIIRHHNWRDVIYVEPYAGGAGAALSLLMLQKVQSIVINDFDPAIYAFWNSVVHNSEAFIEKIRRTPITIEEWEAQQKIYRAKNTADELSLGFAAFFLNRTNRSGILLGAGPIGGKAQAGEWKVDARFNKSALIEKIKLIALHKDQITVTHDDGVQVIKKYAGNPQAFLYIDPPYFVKGAELYLNSFAKTHHENLAETLHTYRDSKWLLSYDNAEDICDLYADFKKEVFALKYSAHHDTKSGDELMIYSDAVTALEC